MPGRPKKITAEEAREVLLESEAPVMATSTVAEEFPNVSRPTVGKRLQELENKGLLDSTQLGNARAWYVPEIQNRRLIEYAAADVEEQTLADAVGYQPIEVETDPTDDASADGETREEAEKELATAGGTTGEVVDEITGFREELNQSQERLTERLETIEERVAQLAAEPSEADEEEKDSEPDQPLTIDGWAERERRASWRVFSRLAVPVPFVLVFLTVVPSSVATVSVPIFGTVARMVLLLGVALTAFAALLGVYWGIWNFSTRTGVTGWLDTTRVGEWYSERRR